VVKEPQRKAHHSLPSSAEIKNAWSYVSTPPYVFMAWCLIKHRGNFTFAMLLQCYLTFIQPERDQSPRLQLQIFYGT
jgi:hypothetical protein